MAQRSRTRHARRAGQRSWPHPDRAAIGSPVRSRAGDSQRPRGHLVRPGKPDGAAHGLGQPLAASTLRRPARRHYGRVVRTNLTVGDLGDLLDKPLVAVLATLRTDGTVLLSPVYHEWRDGGFNIWVEQQNVKARHLRRDPRATILVAESDPPLRAVEVRGRRALSRRVCRRPRCGSRPGTWARRRVLRTWRPCAVPMSSSGSSLVISGCGTTPTSSAPAEASSGQVADGGLGALVEPGLGHVTRGRVHHFYGCQLPGGALRCPKLASVSGGGREAFTARSAEVGAFPERGSSSRPRAWPSWSVDLYLAERTQRTGRSGSGS